MTKNPYLEEIKINLPRLLSLFDSDQTSNTHGMGDRYHWAWGLIDFGNGTYQGAAHGLARLWQAGLWPYKTSKKNFIDRINSIFEAANNLKHKDGSLEESFPREGSYCVTALVAFDLLCAIDLLSEELSDDMTNRWTSIISSMIEYLIKFDEKHALISNHLATSVAALIRWNLLTGDKNAEIKAHYQLNKILSHQSKEGWFKEYEGADPGYQSLCTYYLADVHHKRSDLELIEPLRRSIKFLWNFALPDGSFGGLFGSRSTRFYYPAGVLSLAKEIPEAAVLANFMTNSINYQKVVTLSAMDEPNLTPMFNAYSWSAVIAYQNKNNSKLDPNLQLPCKDKKPFRKYFEHAGLLLDRGPNHYTIISSHKGGVVYHFRKDKAPFINAGVVIRITKKRLASTQSYNQKNIVKQFSDQFEIDSQFNYMTKQIPSPFQFMILRLFSLTIFHSVTLREWFKKFLVKILITKLKYVKVKNKRIIYLGSDLKVEDKIFPFSSYKFLDKGVFVSTHMASKGYWQVQDEKET